MNSERTILQLRLFPLTCIGICEGDVITLQRKAVVLEAQCRSDVLVNTIQLCLYYIHQLGFDPVLENERRGKSFINVLLPLLLSQLTSSLEHLGLCF